MGACATGVLDSDEGGAQVGQPLRNTQVLHMILLSFFLFNFALSIRLFGSLLGNEDDKKDFSYKLYNLGRYLRKVPTVSRWTQRSVVRYLWRLVNFIGDGKF